jgi:hypothetical protein
MICSLLTQQVLKRSILYDEEASSCGTEDTRLQLNAPVHHSPSSTVTVTLRMPTMTKFSSINQPTIGRRTLPSNDEDDEDEECLMRRQTGTRAVGGAGHHPATASNLLVLTVLLPVPVIVAAVAYRRSTIVHCSLNPHGAYTSTTYLTRPQPPSSYSGTPCSLPGM